MSRTPDDRPEVEKPLPRPVGEDGIVRQDEEREDEDVGRIDGGLTDLGSGRTQTRKIV